MIFNDSIQFNQIIDTIKKENKTIARTNGCFDILHPGHITTFMYAKQHADILIVGINGDNSPYWKNKPGRPIHNEYFRSFMVDCLRYVDYVYIFQEETPLETIQIIQPNFLIKGGDYTHETIVGSDFVKSKGGSVLTVPFVDGHSTSNTIQKILSVYGSGNKP